MKTDKSTKTENTTETARKRTRELTGKVVSTAMAKTIVVEIMHTVRHPLYKKAIKRTNKYAVHYEGTGLKVGDTVTIVESRALSKTKHFTVKA